MKKIRKILIVLITIFSMSTTCIINNNVVNAAYTEISGKEFNDTIGQIKDKGVKLEMFSLSNIYSDNPTETGIYKDDDKIKVDQENWQKIKDKLGKESEKTETKLDNTREILPSKLNPNDPNSPILTNPLDPLSAVKKGDIRYDALKNQMSPKYSVQQIKDKITDLDNQIANTNDVAIKQKLEAEKSKWQQQQSAATLSKDGSTQIPEDLMRSTVDATNEAKGTREAEEEDAAEEEDDGLGTPGPLKIITTALDGIVGILFLIPKTIFLICLYTVGQIINLAAGGEFSIESIIFNQAVDHPIGIISIDFFDSTKANKSNTNNLIQENIATWYVAIRNIAITILVIVAMYIAIRMLLATTSEKKAQYKEILIYWVQSLALVFVLHYIMIGIIAINDALIKSLYKAGEQVITGKNNNIMETLFINAFKAIRITSSLANTFAYMVLCFVTIMFFISYLKRMMTIAFLIIIAPLVTVTYSIDKIGDGKSQALNAWLKEFSYTVLIQPFHCITYLALGSIGTQLLERNDSFGDIFIGIYFLSFILQSENIVRGIFGITPNNITNVAGEVGIITAVAGKLGGAKNKGMQYAGDSRANRFMGGAERSGGQKRTPNLKQTPPNPGPTPSPNPGPTPPPNPGPTPPPNPGPTPPANPGPTPPANPGPTPPSNPGPTPPSNPGPTPPSNPGPTPPSNPGPTPPSNQQQGQSNWYDNYSVDDARREELNNKQNRTTAENNELNDINNKAMRNMRKRRTIRRAANGYVGLSMGVAGAMAKMALAVASGDGKAMIAAGFSAKDSIKNNMDNAVERATRGDMIDAYKLARKVSPDKDDNYFKDLAKGKISPSNDQEQEFIDSLSKHQDVMDKHGKIDDKKLDKQTDTLLDNINSGDLDQHNAIYRAGRWIGRRKSN